MKFNLAACSTLLLASSALAAPARSSSNRERTLQRLRNRSTQRLGTHLPIPVAGSTTNIVPSVPPVFANSSESAGPVEYADTEYFSNWAGALWVYNGITEVQGVTNVPQVSIPPGGDASTTYGGAVWVGIDGDTCGNAILQTGVDWIIENGEVSYAAWYEWYPAPLTNFDNFGVSAGDSISMRVVATSTTSGTAYITNESTGQSVSQDFSNQPALCQTNAEWIVEDFSENGGLIPFAAFDPVQITSSTWIANGNTYGLQSATILDIEQNGKVLTDCSLNGATEVDCTYTG